MSKTFIQHIDIAAKFESAVKVPVSQSSNTEFALKLAALNASPNQRIHGARPVEIQSKPEVKVIYNFH